MKRPMPILRHVLVIACLSTLTPFVSAETRSMENADGSYNLSSWDAHGGEGIGASVVLIEQLAMLGAPNAGPSGGGDVLIRSQEAG